MWVGVGFVGGLNGSHHMPTLPSMAHSPWHWHQQPTRPCPLQHRPLYIVNRLGLTRAGPACPTSVPLDGTGMAPTTTDASGTGQAGLGWACSLCTDHGSGYAMPCHRGAVLQWAWPSWLLLPALGAVHHWGVGEQACGSPCQTPPEPPPNLPTTP